MGAVSAAFAEAVGELGVELWLGAEVERITVEHGRATGVILRDGRHLLARAVVSNADPKRTFLRLIEAADVPEEVRARVESLDSSPGGVKLHCALKEAPDLTRLIGSDDPAGVGFIDILAGAGWYERIGPETASGAFPDSAFLQLQIPAFVDRTLTPEGCHIVTAFMPHVAPRLRDTPWRAAASRLAGATLGRIEQWIPNIRSALVDYTLFTPEDLEARVGLTDGNIRHLALCLNQAFESRPLPGWASGKTPIQSLYLCGAGIFPSGEVSGLPGYHAARTVAADFGLALPGESGRREPWATAPVLGGHGTST
jgi:phytoene dehydrogenase-like protein